MPLLLQRHMMKMYNAGTWQCGKIKRTIQAVFITVQKLFRAPPAPAERTVTWYMWPILNYWPCSHCSVAETETAWEKRIYKLYTSCIILVTMNAVLHIITKQRTCNKNSVSVLQRSTPMAFNPARQDEDFQKKSALACRQEFCLLTTRKYVMLKYQMNLIMHTALSSGMLREGSCKLHKIRKTEVAV